MQLEDDTLITIPPSSTIRLDQLSKFKGTGLTDTVIDLSSGSMDASVAPSGNGVGRFEIRTPLAVTGVRGTRFRVDGSNDGLTSAVIEGSVRLQGRQGNTISAPKVVRNGYATRVHADGTLGGATRLLPAPQVGEPSPASGGQWQAKVEPVPGAVAYRVGISRDAQGLYPVSSTVSQSPDVRFDTPGGGTFYMAVRAIDAQGIGGHDAIQEFRTNVLLDSSGDAIVSDTVGSVSLTVY